MALPELTRKQVEKLLDQYCDDRVPPHVRDKVQIKYAFRGDTVTLYEERPVYNDPTRKTQGNVAQFRFDLKSKAWTLYWRDRNSRWHKYDQMRASKVFKELLGEVHRDPTGIFWG